MINKTTIGGRLRLAIRFHSMIGFLCDLAAPMPAGYTRFLDAMPGKLKQPHQRALAWWGLL